MLLLFSASQQIIGPLLDFEAQKIKNLIPVGREYFRVYEDFVRVSINFLFSDHIGEAKPQDRTESGNEGLEIRDLICQNRSIQGVWKDLKDK